MKYTKITKKDLVQAIMQLKDQLYDATVTEHVESSPEDLTPQTPYLDKYKHNRELLDRKIAPTKHYDMQKPLLGIVNREREESDSALHVRCVLRDITDEHGKLASITQYDSPTETTVVINTGTHKYKSIRNNSFLLSLHFAECIFREVVYSTDNMIDINKLDTLMDNFYQHCHNVLEQDLA